jgi:hypothetical protein
MDCEITEQTGKYGVEIPIAPMTGIKCIHPDIGDLIPTPGLCNTKEIKIERT